jgi:hypothetical protein
MQVTSVRFTDNSDKFIAEMERRAKVALEKVGIQAEGHCKVELSNTPKRIDTGLLHNSITHAIGGQAPASMSYRGDKPNRQGVVPSGSYSGTAPAEASPVVYVGTNVEYAPYVEYGTDRMAPNHFIKNGVERYKNEYGDIIKHYMQ